MYTIHLPDGTPLDGSPQLTFNLDSYIFSEGRFDSLGGQYSFPAQLPLTAHNRAALRNPANVHRADTAYALARCRVHLWGTPLFEGTLTINSAQGDVADVDFVVGSVADTNDLRLNELDLGGIRTLGADAAAARAFAKTTFATPGDSEFAFFPVRTIGFLDTPLSAQRYANHYDPIAEAFTQSADNPVAIPFLRLGYVLQRIMAVTGYQFVNEWQSAPAMRSIYLWNNRSIYTPANQWGTTVDLRAHMPDMPCADFLKKICAPFALGLFVSPLRRRIKLRSLRSVIEGAVTRNWTRYAIGTPAVGARTDAPDGYQYAMGDDPDYQRYEALRTYATDRFGPVVGVRESLTDLRITNPPAAAGVYYVKAANAYYSFTPPNQATFLWQELGTSAASPLPDGYRPRETYESADLLPAWPNYKSMNDFDPGGPYPMTPAVSMRGQVQFTNAASELVEQDEPIRMRLMWLRGTAPGVSGGTYPAANVSEYFDDGNAIYSSSLLWQGEQGLYRRWHAAWHNLLLRTRRVTQRLALPVAELADFEFDEKIRIGDMDYIVTRLSVGRPLHEGYVEVEATLQSTV